MLNHVVVGIFKVRGRQRARWLVAHEEQLAVVRRAREGEELLV